MEPTELSALHLARLIRSGQVSARDVVEAHIAVMRRIQPRINPLAAERYDRARAEADAADAKRAAAATPDALPPLLGVPCTIKESLALTGMPNSAGLVSRRGVRAEGNAPVVQRILDAGAIPLGVTNTAELCMWIETDNRLYGRTGNAYDPRRTAGGSSGGEGAAIGSGAAPFGLGSDLAGSIRLPAFFNGVFGHKATAGLVPNTGEFPSGPPREGRLVSKGPLARRAEDLMPILRIIAGPDGRDDFVRPLSLGDPAAVSFTGLRVLVSEKFTRMRLDPKLLAARERAAGALAAAGAKVASVELRDLRRAAVLYLAALDEVTDEGLQDVITANGSAPVTVRTALRRGGPHTLPTLLQVFAERVPASERARTRALAAGNALVDEMAGMIGDGVLLHPPYPVPAPRHGATVRRPFALMTTAVFNLLGVPATVVPLGLGPDGLPLGVQVAAAPRNDHLTIAVALELERALGGWTPPR
ncbi:amidase [Actinomadura monticuli]|uniref:Amidase n=1 Tax=Actinomadura monticuli TaxID=3097367 RepID=A0ABV4QHR3_9ACTN